MGLASRSENVETEQFSHAGEGTMGHVVHEPWPLIASKHALRIIPADSRQTAGQDQRRNQPTRPDRRTNKRRGEQLWTLMPAGLGSGRVSCFQIHPLLSPLLACLRVRSCKIMLPQLPLRISSSSSSFFFFSRGETSLLRSYKGRIYRQ